MTSKLTHLVAQRIEQAILAAGYQSQDKFALAIGLPRETLSRLLGCEVDVRLSTLGKIAKGLGVSPHMLIRTDPIPSAPDADNDPRGLRMAHQPKKLGISVKVCIPFGIEPPEWLKAAGKIGVTEKPAKAKRVAKQKAL